MIVRPLALAMALILAPQRVPRAEDAGIPVRFTEGSVHGFVELRTAAGALLATGDLVQLAHENDVQSRMVFHFPDSSVFEETVSFGQRGVFTMLSYHLVQRGPAFTDDLDASVVHSGRYVVTSRSHRTGKAAHYTGTLELPPDVYNGMIILVAKNLPAGDAETVHVIAFTPRPLLIGLAMTPSGSRLVANGQHTETAVDYTLSPRLGAARGLLARVLGKTPPDSHAWIVTDEAPAFVRYVGPLYAGPVWRIDVASPGLSR